MDRSTFHLQAIPASKIIVILLVQGHLDGFLRLARGADNEALVVFQDVKPILNVSGAVAEAARRFQTGCVHQRRGSDFRYKLFFGIRFRTEERGLFQPIQALAVAGGMGQLMKRGAVILGGFGELRSKRKRDGIVSGAVTGLIAFDVVKLYA